tara:strand:- start:7599 stop:8183 length:585 start_codon:yes stop_codon:yes gene_type:complete
MIFDFLTANWFEIVAAALAITYLILAMQQNILCWAAWIISSIMYLFVMFSAGLYMESGLQIFYIVMGIYGWIQWNNRSSNNSLTVSTWPIINHIYILLILIFLVTFSGLILSNLTEAVSPYIDAFTTWGAIIATYMVAKKILENWYYWFVVDFVSVFLFLSRELYTTALLFSIYIILVIFGFIAWRKSMRLENV